MEARARYFRLMEDVMYELICVNFLKERYINIERWTNIILAVFSSSGIASWFFWKEYAIYAAFAIAISQIVSIAMPFFEMRKKIEKLLIASDEMQELADHVENRWAAVNSKLSDEEIDDLISSIRTKQKKYLSGLVRPNDKTCTKAEKRLNQYIKTHFYE